MKNVEVRKSKTGKGVFTQKGFKKGSDIFEIKGVLISCDMETKVDERTRSNTIRYDEDLYLSPTGEVADFLNHSCEPNARVVKKGKKLYIFALENIESGQEVLIDYSAIIAEDDAWTMKCKCGSKKCRKIIGQFIKLPEVTQKEYLRRKMVPKYILS